MFLSSASQIKDGIITLPKLVAATQGDIIYFNGTNWIVLNAGISGHFLKTQGAAANPLWAAAASGGLTLVEDRTLVTAATTISFTGLDLDTDVYYFIIGKTTNTAVASAELRLGFNTDTTLTDYYTQYYYAQAAALAAARINSPTFMSTAVGEEVFFYILLTRDAAGRTKAIVMGGANDPASSYIQNAMVSWVTAANVTSIQFFTDIANSYGIGSRFTVYKIKP
jgi:hypothetical protein